MSEPDFAKKESCVGSSLDKPSIPLEVNVVDHCNHDQHHKIIIESLHAYHKQIIKNIKAVEKFHSMLFQQKKEIEKHCAELRALERELRQAKRKERLVWGLRLLRFRHDKPSERKDDTESGTCVKGA